MGGGCHHDDDTTAVSAEPAAIPFGSPMRRLHFSFAPSYTPLNHGSFGTYPVAVRDYQRSLQAETEARPDTEVRIKYPHRLRDARQAVASLLGSHTEEVVFVPNALTAINTVLRNLEYQDGDVILYFSTAYNGCLSTIMSLEDTTPVRGCCIDLVYPIDDDDILAKVVAALSRLQQEGSQVVLAMFDTILTFPGVRFPWESMVQLCRKNSILTCVDGAHGIGHLDLTHLARVAPDFFISNCYKWLMTPRGCAILYVPSRNHHLIKTTFPTTGVYLSEEDRHLLSPTEYFVRLFERVSTIDTSPYLCVTKALKFRTEVCGGEERIRQYSVSLAKRGGEAMAELMGTGVLENKNQTLRECYFAMVRLPLNIDKEDDTRGDIPRRDAQAVADWMTYRSVVDFDSFIPVRYYAGCIWSRLSSQIYLEIRDFVWAAKVLLELCARAKTGDWKRLGADEERMLTSR
ncbi:aminotransferase family protein-like protein [Xylariaceae sp. FL0255]|nr:aminotransferase family protein-like protein [Xylariaceae sp. FL0255]